MSDTNIGIKIGIEKTGSGENIIKKNLEEIKAKANDAGKAVADIGKKASAKLPLTDSMKEMLSSAERARKALTHMAENGGVKVFEKHLYRVNELLTEIRQNSKLGQALGVGKNYDMSGFKELDSFSSKMGSIITKLNQEDRARADLLQKLSRQKYQAELEAQRGIVREAKLASDAEIKAKQKAADETKRLAREKAEAERIVATEQANRYAMANSQWAQMGRSAYANYQQTGDISAYRKDLEAILDMRDRSQAATRLGSFVATGDIDKQADAVRRLASESEKASVSIKKVGESSVGSTSKLGNLAKSFLRIAKLRLLRGILRSITQAFSEGIGNIYQYSQALGGLDASHFSTQMDALASSLARFKNAIGTAVAPLLSSVIPVLQTIVGWATKVVDALAQMFAALNGQTTYTRAKEISVQWKAAETGAQNATDAANEYKRTLLGFDEINALGDQSSGSGGGSGGSGGSVSPEDMFEEVDLATDGLQGVLNEVARFAGKAGKLVAEALDATPEGWQAAIDAAIGVLTGNDEKIKDAYDHVQHILSTHDSLNHLYDGILEFESQAFSSIERVFLEAKKKLLEAAKGILETLQPILEALGVDVDGLLSSIDTEIEAVNKQIDFSTKKADLAKDAFQKWADGDYSFEQLQTQLAIAQGAFGETEDSIKAAQDAAIAFEEAGFDPKELLDGLSGIKDPAEKSQQAIENMENAIKKMKENGKDTTEMQKALDDYKKSVGAAETSVKNIGKEITNTKDKKADLKQPLSVFGSLKKALVGDNGKGGIWGNLGELGKKLLGLKDVKPNVSKIKERLNIIKSVARNSGKALGNLIKKTNGFKAAPDVSGIIQSLLNIKQNADNTTGSLQGIMDKVALLSNPKKFVQLVTAKLTGNSEGGFVNGYAQGGIIPRFDGGGIHSAQLFMANENGMPPELIGNIGNRTAVANQGQMVAAMAQGVYEAMMEVMSASSGANEVNVYIDGERVARAVDRANRLANRRFNVGVV